MSFINKNCKCVLCNPEDVFEEWTTYVLELAEDYSKKPQRPESDS
jgi:hypothetical protein